MAITRQTTSWDGSLRWRSSLLSVLPTASVIASGGIAVSMALNTSADSLPRRDEGEFFEMHFALCLPFERT